MAMPFLRVGKGELVKFGIVFWVCILPKELLGLRVSCATSEREITKLHLQRNANDG